MEELLRQIREDTSLRIGGRLLRVKAKSVYVTQSAPETAYTKIFLEGHHVLVLCPEDDFAYFGRDIGSIGVDPPLPEAITYEGTVYRLDAHDYQIVREFQFGDPLETEGEVEFWDYEGVSDQSMIISVGIIQRTGERADIVANVVDDISGIVVEQRRT